MLAALLSQVNAAKDVKCCVAGACGDCPATVSCPDETECFFRQDDNCNQKICYDWKSTTTQYSPLCTTGQFVPASEAACQAIPDSNCNHREAPRLQCPGNYCLRRTSCCNYECQDPQGTAAEETGCPELATWCPVFKEKCPVNSCTDCANHFGKVSCTTTNVNKCLFQVWKSSGDRRRVSRRRSSGNTKYKCPESHSGQWCYVVNPNDEDEWQCRKTDAEGLSKVCAAQPNLQGCPTCDVMNLPFGGHATCNMHQCLVQTGCCKWECQYIHEHPVCPKSLQPALTGCTPKNDPDNSDRRRALERRREDDEEPECEVDQCIAYTGCWGKQECIGNTAAWELHENKHCMAWKNDGTKLEIGKSLESSKNAHAKCLTHNKSNPTHKCTGVFDRHCDANKPHDEWLLCTTDKREGFDKTYGKTALLTYGKYAIGKDEASLGCTYVLKGEETVDISVADMPNNGRRRIASILRRLQRLEL